jgi:DNA-binding Xre family transcriptional regulator
MGQHNPQEADTVEIEPLKYRDDLIRAQIAAKQWNSEKVAELAGVGLNQVSAVRNGAPNIRLQTLHAICRALGLTLHDVFEPKPEEKEELVTG